MINGGISDWSIFQVVPIAGQTGIYSIDENDVLTINSQSSTTLNIIGVNLDVNPGDVLRFECDAYATEGSRASISVQTKAIGDGVVVDIAGAMGRSTKYIPTGKWTHCVTSYRIPLNSTSKIGNACCGFGTAETGVAKFKNPKVFINDTLIPTNNMVSSFSGTYNNYIQFIGNSGVKVDPSYQSLITKQDYSTQNRVFAGIAGRANLSAHDAIVGLKTYNDETCLVRLQSTGSDSIGKHKESLLNNITHRIEFWGDSDTADSYMGHISYGKSGNAEDGYTPSNIALYNGVTGKGNTKSLVIYGTTANHAVTPGEDNIQYLGSASFRWNTIFCTSGTINTSDIRYKDNISAPFDALMRAWGKVNFKIFQFKDAIQEKGENHARLHVGIIAQEVIEAFASEGLDASRYGLLCYDEWDEEWESEKIIDEEAYFDENKGEFVEEKSHIEKRRTQEAGNRYGIRYEEALALECAYQRWLGEKRDARIAELEARLNENSGNSPAPSGASPNNL